MIKKFKKGYITKGWWNTLTNKYIENEYAITITKVIQSDEFGKFEDIDEDEIISYGGYKNIEEAKSELLKIHKVKEIEID